MDVLGRGCAYIKAKLSPWALSDYSHKLILYSTSRFTKWGECIKSFPPASFILRLTGRIINKLKSNRHFMILVRLLSKFACIVLDKRRPILRCSLFLLVSIALMAHVLAFSTPWWIFIDGHYTEPCNHIQGLWEMCIMTKRGVIDACESSFELEKEHPTSSYVSSCGDRSIHVLRLFSIRVLEVTGLVLATLSEIILLQFLLNSPKNRRPRMGMLIAMMTCMIGAGTTIVWGFIECKKQVDMWSRPDDSMRLEWSAYISHSAGVVFIVTGFLPLLL